MTAEVGWNNCVLLVTVAPACSFIVPACPWLFLLVPAWPCLSLPCPWICVAWLVHSRPSLSSLTWPDLTCHSQDLIGPLQEEVDDEVHLEHLEDHHHIVRVGEVPGPAVAASGLAQRSKILPASVGEVGWLGAVWTRSGIWKKKVLVKY